MLDAPFIRRACPPASPSLTRISSPAPPNAPEATKRGEVEVSDGDEAIFVGRVDAEPAEEELDQRLELPSWTQKISYDELSRRRGKPALCIS